MFSNHMTLQIHLSLENDKLLFPTFVFGTTVVNRIEMFFQFIIIQEIFISTTRTDADEALFVPVSAMFEKGVRIKKEDATEIAGWMTGETVVECLSWRLSVWTTVVGVVEG